LETPGQAEIDKLRSNLAAVYTHYRVKSEYQSAVDSIFTGLIRAIGWEIHRSTGKVTLEDLEKALRQLLHIEAGKARLSVAKAVQTLVRMGLASLEHGSYLFKQPDDSIDEDLGKVTKSIKDRINVRYSARISLKDEKVKEFILVSLVHDGVRLAHSILSRYPLTGAVIDSILESSYEKVLEKPIDREGQLLLLCY